jgi:hypothetical protein
MRPFTPLIKRCVDRFFATCFDFPLTHSLRHKKSIAVNVGVDKCDAVMEWVMLLFGYAVAVNTVAGFHPARWAA